MGLVPSVEQVAEQVGGSMKKQMGGMVEENMDKMMDNQQRMAMQRRELMMAQNIAFGRDLFHWWSAFTGTVATLASVGYLKKGKVAGFIPLLPLSFVCAYQYDMVYGSKYKRIRREADRLLSEEWSKGDENRFLPPEKSLLITRDKYEQFTKRD